MSYKLLVCYASLVPRAYFSKFDVEKLARLTEIYQEDFSFDDHKIIRDKLQTFIAITECDRLVPPAKLLRLRLIHAISPDSHRGYGVPRLLRRRFHGDHRDCPYGDDADHTLQCHPVLLVHAIAGFNHIPQTICLKDHTHHEGGC